MARLAGMAMRVVISVTVGVAMTCGIGVDVLVFDRAMCERAARACLQIQNGRFGGRCP